MLMQKDTSMIKQYHNYTMQSNTRHCEEEPQNNYSHKISGKQLKQPVLSAYKHRLIRVFGVHI